MLSIIFLLSVDFLFSFYFIIINFWNLVYWTSKAFELWILWFKPLSPYFALLSSSRASQKYIGAYSDWYTAFEDLSHFLLKNTKKMSV